MKLKQQLEKTWVKLILIFLCCLLVECTFLQYRFFMPLLSGGEAKTLHADDITVSGNAKLTDDYIEINGEATLSFEPETALNSVELDVVGNVDAAARISWIDEGSAWGREGVEQKLNKLESTRVVYLSTQGKCSSATLNIRTNQPLKVVNIKLNMSPFSIQWLRVIVFTLLIFLLFLAVKNRVWRQKLDLSEKSYSGQMLVTACFVLFMVIVFLLSPGYEVNTEHCSLSKLVYDTPDANDAYMMQTDAFAKGQISLDIEPSEELLNCENPYDSASRYGIDYVWDFAFYNGKYYSYFGVVPMLILLPFRLLTGKFLSTYVFSFLLAVCAAFALSKLYSDVVRKLFKSVNALVYYASLTALLFGSGLAFLTARSWFYEVPYTSGLLLSFLALDNAVLYTQSAEKRNTKLILSALFLALSVGCRPTYLFTALPVLAMVVPTLLRQKKKPMLLQALCFIAPLAVIGGLLAAYNYVRFDSIFEFGARYQLTVSDVRFNSLKNLPSLVQTMSCYLFEQPKISGVFPFVAIDYAPFVQMSQTAYLNGVVGLLAYPLSWLTLLTPLALKGRDKSAQRLVATLLIATLIMIAVIGTSGGVAQRYACDYQWMAFLACGIIALCLAEKAENDKTPTAVIGIFIALALSILMFAAISFTGEFARSHNVFDEVYSYLRDTFELIR